MRRGRGQTAARHELRSRGKLEPIAARRPRGNVEAIAPAGRAATSRQSRPPAVRQRRGNRVRRRRGNVEAIAPSGGAGLDAVAAWSQQVSDSLLALAIEDAALAGEPPQL